MPMVNGQSVGTFEGSFGRDRNLGLTTGSTIYGNTAFGPSGGRASGYATRSGGNTMGPGNANYSNFRTRDGGVAFGNVGGMQFNAPNARAAAGYANAMNRAMAAPPPRAVPAGFVPPGLARRAVSGVMGRPAFGPPPAAPLNKAMMPGLFGGTPPAPQPAAAQYPNTFGPRYPSLNFDNGLNGMWGPPTYQGVGYPNMNQGAQLGLPGVGGSGLGNYASGSNWSLKGGLGY